MTLLATHSAAQADTKEQNVKEKLIYGWLEWVTLEPSGMKAKAKLDTGAKTSSMHAKNIEWFEKDGAQWIRFQFSPDTKLSDKKFESGKSKKVVTLEAPLVRNVTIKQHKRTNVKRPVVWLTFKLADKEYKAQFSLTDRSKFHYPVLFGRRFLEQVAIVDPGSTYLRTSDTLAREDADPETLKPQSAYETKNTQ